MYCSCPTIPSQPPNPMESNSTTLGVPVETSATTAALKQASRRDVDNVPRVDYALWASTT